ncbi:UNVERIFIED_CONTAM: hypothetical protein HHA_454930 [Hammondia hammondi]|eukprot:XP_008888627.1 hypothetical protein HHA_454930 [Hammondia hammondi]
MSAGAPVSIIDLEIQVERLINSIGSHSEKVTQGSQDAFANKFFIEDRQEIRLVLVAWAVNRVPLCIRLQQACRLGFKLASIGAVELAWSAICEYFEGEVEEQVRTVFGLPDKNRGTPTNSASSHKNGDLARYALLGENLENKGTASPRLLSTSRRSTDLQLVAAVYRMLQLRTLVTFHRVSKNDPHLHMAHSVREVTARLEECQHYLRAFVQLPCQDRESHYWIPLNCSTMIYSICGFLRTKHHGSMCRPCLAWALSCLDASVPLLSPQYLRWKSTLALRIIRISESERAFDDAGRVCERMLGEVRKLELYESMEPPVPDEIKNILAHTEFFFTALRLKYKCWSEELPVSSECSPI